MLRIERLAKSSPINPSRLPDRCFDFWAVEFDSFGFSHPRLTTQNQTSQRKQFGDMLRAVRGLNSKDVGPHLKETVARQQSVRVLGVQPTPKASPRHW